LALWAEKDGKVLPGFGQGIATKCVRGAMTGG
jgi:hypothetical protein